MTWRRERWTADHPLPIGVTKRAQVGELVRAGDIIAAGATLAGALRVPGARRLGLSPPDLDRELRVRVGSDVVAGTVLARVGRRFARSVTAPIDGRLLHVTVDGDLYIAPIVDRWTVRATLDGTVARSDDAVVEIEGEAWCFQAAAAYGPDAIGELTLGVDGPDADLAPTRIDVRLAGRIIVGGARVRRRRTRCGWRSSRRPSCGVRRYGDRVGVTQPRRQADRPLPDGLRIGCAAARCLRALRGACRRARGDPHGISAALRLQHRRRRTGRDAVTRCRDGRRSGGLRARGACRGRC